MQELQVHIMHLILGNWSPSNRWLNLRSLTKIEEFPNPLKKQREGSSLHNHGLTVLDKFFFIPLEKKKYEINCLAYLSQIVH